MRFRHARFSRCLGPVACLLAGCSAGSGSLTAVTPPPFGGVSQKGAVSPQSLGTFARVPARSYSVLPEKMLDQLRPTGVAPAPFVDIPAVMTPPDEQVIISDFTNNSVTVFGGEGKVDALLTKGLVNPQGLLTDPSGTLYVANTGAQNLLVYPKPYTTVATTYDDTGWYPSDVALAGDGTVAAINILSSSLGNGSVTMYAKGSTEPCATISDPNWSKIFFGAFDKNGTLYIDGIDVNIGTTAIVGRVTGECHARRIERLAIKNFIFYPGGVQTRGTDDILVGDQTNRAVYTYRRPSGRALGSPRQTALLVNAFDPVTFALRPFAQNLWVADAGFHVAAEYPYRGVNPSFKTLEAGFTQPVGVAVNPVLP